MYVSFVFLYNINMNQILLYKVNNRLKKIYIKILLGIIVLIILVLFFIVKENKIIREELKYSETINSFGKISELYFNNDNVKYMENKMYFGRIIIEKINLDYMILNEYSEDNLKISICRLSGENLNGNISIIGHNYENGTFFSNLNKLNIEDRIVLIIDGEKIEYKIYDIYEVLESDLSPLKDNNFSEITLITCNNFNKKRYIIKGKNIDSND